MTSAIAAAAAALPAAALCSAAPGEVTGGVAGCGLMDARTKPSRASLHPLLSSKGLNSTRVSVAVDPVSTLFCAPAPPALLLCPTAHSADPSTRAAPWHTTSLILPPSACSCLRSSSGVWNPPGRDCRKAAAVVNCCWVRGAREGGGTKGGSSCSLQAMCRSRKAGLSEEGTSTNHWRHGRGSSSPESAMAIILVARSSCVLWLSTLQMAAMDAADPAPPSSGSRASSSIHSMWGQPCTKEWSISRACTIRCTWISTLPSCTVSMCCCSLPAAEGSKANVWLPMRNSGCLCKA
mmetsp:Transcript_28911/g.77893  ORF Transcript_28911/g.77893 Transcript_28911/m.77893 type:complete len:293 (-) Transcript_28911:296-1174(-)